MPLGAWLLEHPISRDAIDLGSLVLNIRRPWDDFKTFSAQLSPTDTITTPQTDLKHFFSRYRNADLSAHVSSLFKAAAGAQGGSSVEIGSRVASHYALRNSGEIFRTLRTDAGAKEFMERCYVERGRAPYFVVGIFTLQDASITTQAGSSLHGEGTVHFPPPGAPVPPGMGGSVSAAGQSGSATHTSAVASSEQIFAVEYRKVRLSWLSRTDLESAKLAMKVTPAVAKVAWALAVGARGEIDENEDDDEEAGLGADVEGADLSEESLVQVNEKEGTEFEVEEQYEGDGSETVFYVLKDKQDV